MNIFWNYTLWVRTTLNLSIIKAIDSTRCMRRVKVKQKKYLLFFCYFSDGSFSNMQSCANARQKSENVLKTEESVAGPQ